LETLAVRESGVVFTFAIRLFVKLSDITAARKGGVPAGVNSELLEKCAAAGMKLIRKPSQVGLLPTSVGFATSAHAKCAFFVLQKIRGTLLHRVGTRRTAGYAVNLCESTLLSQTMSIAIFQRLTLYVA